MPVKRNLRESEPESKLKQTKRCFQCLFSPTYYLLTIHHQKVHWTLESLKFNPLRKLPNNFNGASLNVLIPVIKVGKYH